MQDDGQAPAPLTLRRRSGTGAAVIREPYLLLTRLPLFAGADGLYADDLWEKDLSAHLGYIGDLRIACPVEPAEAARSPLKRVDGLSAAQVVRLRTDRGWGSVAANIVPNFVSVGRAVRQSTIVHSSCAGWAFPLAYYVLLLRPFLKFKWVNVVESSFWVKPASGRVSARQRIEHPVHEFMVRRCVRGSDARIFTQDGYRQTYLGSHDAALVAPAVWVDDDDMRDARALADARAKGGSVRLLFPARLEAEKGVETVLAAIALLDASDDPSSSIEIDIIGEGPLADRCRTAIASRRRDARARVRFHDPVPYGARFFALLRQYDGAIVANRQAEQARIVFDAMSQGLACFVSDTVGNRAVVDDGATGAIFAVDDAAALCALLRRAALEPDWVRAMGRQAREKAQHYTHRGMHAQRETFLKVTLSLQM